MLQAKNIDVFIELLSTAEKNFCMKRLAISDHGRKMALATAGKRQAAIIVGKAYIHVSIRDAKQQRSLRYDRQSKKFILENNALSQMHDIVKRIEVLHSIGSV